MQRRHAIALLLALVPQVAGAAESCPVPPAASGAALAAALAEINRLRAQAGVPALTLNAKLINAAQRHAADMADNNYFSHTSRDGRTVVQRIEAAGYTSWTAWGENIAWGQQDWRAAIASWNGSPGHRANMLSRNFKEIGLGAKNKRWVQDFGAARPTATAQPLVASSDAGGRIGQPIRSWAP
jgi:uncharacterized protein YkwD